jgi:alkylation response protein AidB-like acyl-CoA dehydrogenase
MAEMIYDLSDDLAQFRDVIEAYLRKSYGDDARREIVASDLGYSPEVWQALAIDIGVLGMGFDEAHGGFGGGAIAQIPVMEAFGRALLVEPYLETVILAGGILARSTNPVALGLIEGIIAGDVRLAVARIEPGHRFAPDRVETLAEPIGAQGYRLTGHKSVVVAAPWAHHILVVARIEERGPAVFVVPADAKGLSIHDLPTIDGRRAGDIHLDVVVDGDACLLEGDDATAALDSAYDKATVAICAEAVGIMRRLLGDTLAHLEERKQFGTTLATFQALQHRMADMLVSLELSAAHVYRAASALDLDTSDRKSAVSAAKAFVGRAVHRAAQGAMQMHGGIGTTDELTIGHLFKRAVVIEAQFGSTDHHVRRFQALRAT